MKAFIIDRYGKNRALRLGEMPKPVPGPDDILVRVHAAALNPLDTKIRDGEFKLILPYHTPFIAGHDVAGTVIEVGANVCTFQSGDEIYARPRDGRIGTFAQYIAIDQADAALKPKNLSMEEAASIPLVALTAWQVLTGMGDLRRGQKVLIHAGSGGFGTIAIQLAKHLGATVATTTSTANVDLVKSLGADVVIDYKQQDFAAILSDYDLVINSLDSETLRKSVEVLKPGGKLISISGPPDPAFAHARGMNPVLRLVMQALSFGIRRKVKAKHASYSFLFMHAGGGELGQLTKLIEAGIVHPVVDRVFPFEETNDALAYVQTGRAKGKVVVAMSLLRVP